MAKRKNPNRIPATQADVERAERAARLDALTFCWAVMFTVLRDKEGYGKDDLHRMWSEVEYLSDSIAKGYTSVRELRKTLNDEDGIKLS